MTKCLKLRFVATTCALIVALIAVFAMFLFEKDGAAYASRQKGSAQIVIEQSTCRILHAVNENERLYPASTTKILTALVVLEHLSVDTTVAIPSSAIGVEGSSIYLKEGETLTVGELLYGMLLRSGNDAAQALAIATAGNVAAFAELMNKTATACGAVNSHFVNPHGLHDDGHYTTALDLAKITAKAMENQTFCQMVNTTFVSIGEGENVRYFRNKNKFLHMFDGANGVKTGFTETSGRCLVTSAKRDNMQLIGVSLNCSNDWEVHANMLERCFAEYAMMPTERYLTANGTVEVKCSFDNEGNVTPRAYPLKRDGTENMNIVF